MKLPENYILEKKRIKHARIRVSENLSVRVLVPLNFNQTDISRLLLKKENWIDKNLKRFVSSKEKIKLHDNQILLFGNKYNYFYREDLGDKVIVNHDHRTIQAKKNLLDLNNQMNWYRRFAKNYLTERLKNIAKENRFRYNRLFVRDQKTKWGNCSNQKNISLNWKLIKAPKFVIDYLICHELLHTRTMNHSTKFWSELKVICPDYAEAVNWLEKYGNSL